MFPKHFFSKKNILISIIFILGILSLITHFNKVDIRFEEPRRMLVAIEMIYSGNFITPTVFNETYLNKPPLFNWLLISVFYLFNSFNLFTIRILTVVFILALAFTNYWITKKYISKQVAFFSSIFFIITPDIFYHDAMYGEITLFHHLLVLLQIISIFHFHHKKKLLLLFIVSYFFTAMGVLAKGLPSVVFQVFTLLGYFIYNKQFKQLVSWQHLLGILVFTGITTTYFYLYSEYSDVMAFLGNLFNESSERTAVAQKSGNFILGLLKFPLNFLGALFPWILLTGFIFYKKTWLQIKTNKLVVFYAIFFCVNIIIYWISPGVRNRYLYIFYPAVLIPITWAFILNANSNKFYNKIIYFLFALIMVVSALAFLYIPFIPDAAKLPNIYIKSVVLSISSMIVFILYFRTKLFKIYYFIIFLIIVRFAFNFIQLPSLQLNNETQAFENHLNNILKITKDKPVHFCAQPNYITTSFKLGPLMFSEPKQTKVSPLDFGHKLGIALFFRNGHLVKYHITPYKNVFYIIPTNQLKLHTGYTELYSFYEQTWTKNHLSLVYFK